MVERKPRVEADARDERRFSVVDHHAAGVGPGRREGIVARHDAGEAAAGTPKSPGGSTPSGATIRKRARPGGAEQVFGSRQATSGSSRSAKTTMWLPNWSGKRDFPSRRNSPRRGPLRAPR